MLSSPYTSANDMSVSSTATRSSSDDDEYLFSEKTSLLVNDKLIRRQSSYVFRINESEQRTLGNEEQIALLVIFTVITLVSLAGNLLTICMLAVRKQRFPFKACLFSLAISDLTFTLASGSHYIVKLLNDATPLWNLGWIGCMAVPFLQTAAVLTESMSLILIALDRFLAVRNKSNAKLLQSKLFCLSVILSVWMVGFAISSPMLLSYVYIDAIVIPDDTTLPPVEGFVCITDMDDSATYYIIVFTFIFIPVFVGFIWLNTIISHEIWKRRHAPGMVGSNQKQSKSPTRQKTDLAVEGRHDDKAADVSKDSSTMEMKNTDETNTASSNSSMRGGKVSHATGNATTNIKRSQHTNAITNQVASTAHASTERQKRQMRMFKVILILMSVFICCRLPNWIFLLYKLKYNISGSLNWTLLYTFGALGLLNGALNPFLYAFLNETIRVTASLIAELRRLFACCCCCRERKSDDSTSNYANNQQQIFAAVANTAGRRKSDGGIYLGA